MRRIITGLCLALAAGCSSTTSIATGDLSGPVGVVAAKAFAGATSTDVVYVANADRDELRAYLPGSLLFVRGPNAISPLSIPVGFRPEHLAAGIATGAGSLGYVLVGGAAPGVTLIDTQTHRTVFTPACASPAVVAPACLPGEVIDVAAGSQNAFALVADDGAGSQAVEVMTPTIDGAATGQIPNLVHSRLIPVPGRFAGLASNALGTSVYLADRDTGRVVLLNVAAGTTTVLTAAAPVRDVVVVPLFVDANGATHPDGEFVLALLADGRMQTLDPARGGPAADPIDDTQPIAPLDFLGAPIRDVAFVPCASPSQGCKTLVGDGSSSPPNESLLAFAALGDGTFAALTTLAAHPQVFVPINKATSGASVTGNDCAGAGNCVEDDSTTTGVTRLETVTATFGGALPGLTGRVGTLDSTTTPARLTDPVGGLSGAAGAQVGDKVSATIVGAPCPGVSGPISLTVTGAAPTELTLTADPAIPAGCTSLRVKYGVNAAGDRPWYVAGSVTGFVTRAKSGDRIVVPGTRYFYAASLETGNALAFTLPAADPAIGTAVTVSTSAGFSPYTLPTGTGGLASGIAATPGRVFATVLHIASSNITSTGPHLFDVTLATANTTSGIQSYR